MGFSIWDAGEGTPNTRPGLFEKPTPPVLLGPIGGEEISNLNPILNISWVKSSDTIIETTKSLTGKGYYVNDINLQVTDQFTGIFSSTVKRYGRVKSVQFNIGYGMGTDSKPVKPNDIQAEIRSVTIANGVATLGQVDYTGYLESNGTFNIPPSYAKFYDMFVCRIKSSVDGYYMVRTASYGEGDGLDGVFTTDVVALDYIEAMITYSASYQDDLRYSVELSLDNGGSWINLGNNMANITSMNVDMTEYINTHETYGAKIRVRSMDDTGEIKYYTGDPGNPVAYYPPNYSDWYEMELPFTIIKHIAPSQPINLKSSATGVIDREIVNRLSWKYIQNSMNNRQGRANIQWRKQGDTTWIDIPVAGLSQFYDVPANTFPIGTIEWKVKTYNYVDMEGPYSEISTFVAKDTPTGPTITTPVSEVAEPSPPITIEHNYIQTHYEIKVFDVADTIVWETGVVQSNSLSIIMDKYLDNLSTYTIKTRIKTNEGLWTSYTTKLFTTDYQYPAPPIASIEANNGFISVSYANPEPTGEQPIVARNEVYKWIDNEWTKISNDSPFSFQDYAVASGTTHQYKVRAVAQNGSYTESEVVSAFIKLKGTWLYLVSDPAGTIRRFKKDGLGREQKWTIESAPMNFKGRKYTAIEIGTMEEYVVSFTLALTPEEKETLDTFIYSGQIVCYRDGRGRMLHSIFTEYPLVDEKWGGYTAQLTLTKIDYIEGI